MKMKKFTVYKNVFYGFLLILIFCLTLNAKFNGANPVQLLRDLKYLLVQMEKKVSIHLFYKQR